MEKVRQKKNTWSSFKNKSLCLPNDRNQSYSSVDEMNTMQRKQREILTEYVMMAYIHGTLKLNGDKENINVLERRLDSASTRGFISILAISQGSNVPFLLMAKTEKRIGLTSSKTLWSLAVGATTSQWSTLIKRGRPWQWVPVREVEIK